MALLARPPRPAACVDALARCALFDRWLGLMALFARVLDRRLGLMALFARVLDRRLGPIRWALASFATVWLVGGLLGCGGSSKAPTSAPRAPANRSSSVANVPPALTQHPNERLPMSAYEPPTHLPLKGDSDRDAPTWDDGYRSPDDDEDARLDHQPSDANEGYRDADDLDSLRVGIPESPASTKAIEALVRRYYAVAATGDGAKACALMARGFANAVPVDYGRYGPSYLHAGKTCAQIATLDFQHNRSLITTKLVFTAVHEENPDRAYALFGSRTTPASFIGVNREHGVWKIGALLGGPEP